MTTPNLTLAELTASQSQPHVTVNSSLRRLDGIVMLAVLSRDSAVPATSPTPADGDRYLIIAGSPTSAQVNNIAWWNGTGWEYLTPNAGWLCWVIDEAALYVYSTGSPFGWQLLVAL